ncbi:N-methyltryptophan oxidase [Dyadobacter beijingensis]|uniref:N-methyltryptophan oxidase n=1 Tax=Dyadobacter beijingensis TaxID=365489 RepID=A0ABQ2I0R0_9BACT|nr:FAD-dependent oxidoreductase [Dyadobacter beijingensis]GGM95469.1 N-methyltryptophan oxidase [Dyadobacter beijingensis]
MAIPAENHFDVIVIGGGAMGLSTGYHLGKRNARTLVLEQFSFKNQLGSSAGVSRQYRIPYPEEYMVQMALDAQPYWDELQSLTPKTLLDKVGTLWFGDPSVHSTEGNIAEAEQALKALNVPYTSLTAKEIETQYHFRNLPETYTGLFQADGASIDFRATIETLYQACERSPYTTLRDESPVTGIEQNGGIFTVITPKGTFTSEKLVLVPGPYVDSVINLLGFTIEATYWNMSSCYFKKTDPAIRYPTWFVFQNAIGSNGNQFYGFPGAVWDHPEYIRVAPDFVIDPLTSPEQRTLVPNPKELAYTAQWVRDHMTGLDPTPHYTSTCLIALSKIENKELLIDFAPPYVPNHENIVVYATGWAAKFTPFLGKILTEMALDGHSTFDITPFKLGYNYFKAL